jgi:hypothetical protein
MTEQTTQGALCRAEGCDRPVEEGTSFPGCREHRRVYDAQAKEEAWGLAESILRPWVEATRPIGSEELTGAMEVALREVELLRCRLLAPFSDSLSTNSGE